MVSEINMAELQRLYDEGVSMRGIARKLETTYCKVRYALVIKGIHAVSQKSRKCKKCPTLFQPSLSALAAGRYLCELCVSTLNHKHQIKKSRMSPSEYASMLESQGGVCAICKASEGHRSKHGVRCRLAVDHNHRTGKVRGLLCMCCNRGLGRFKDSADTLRDAALYLERE